VITYCKDAADAGDTDAQWWAADLLMDAERTDEAISWLQERVGRTDEVITYCKDAAEAGDTDALRWAADLLVEAGRTDEAISWLQARAETGDTAALWWVADLLEKAGRTDEVAWLRRYGIKPGGGIAERWAGEDQ
jgi:hypothetical protein